MGGLVKCAGQISTVVSLSVCVCVLFARLSRFPAFLIPDRLLTVQIVAVYVSCHTIAVSMCHHSEWQDDKHWGGGV